MIVVRCHTGVRRASPSGTLGRDIMHSWAYSHEHRVLAGMQIDYTFRGYCAYRLSGDVGGVDYWIDYVLSIEREDYDIVKIALGRVRVFFSEEDEITDIGDTDTRQKLRMDLLEPEEWERALNNPPKKTTIITHNK